ncbi:MAG: hypothetical protein ACLRY8_15240 [Clostridium butyricum]
MSKDMNKLLQQTIKYDLGSGLLIALLIVLSSSFLNAMMYFLGTIVGMLNFVCSYYVTTKMLFEGGARSVLAVLITFFRILAVVIIAIPLMNNLRFVVLYVAGFISHLVVLGISCMLKNK